MTEIEFREVTQELGLEPRQDIWGLYAYYGPTQDDWVAHYDFKEHKGYVFFGGVRERAYNSPDTFRQKLQNRLKEMKEEKLRWKLADAAKDFY